MTANERALFDAVLAAPDDDAPRLVYADALSERDDPRGEFITVQCALARGKGTAAQLKALRSREEALLAAHAEEWLGPLQRFLRQNDAYGLSALKVQRGFPVAVRVQLSDPQVLPTLFRLAPLVERLALRGDRAPYHPRLAALTHLEADGECAFSAADWLSTHRFERLTHLTLDFGFMPRGSGRLALGGQPALAVLEVTESAHLAEVSLPPTLQRLAWPRFELADELRKLEALRVLRLGLSPLDPPMLEAVLSHAATLTTLEVNTRNWAALEALLTARWPALEHLDLSNARLGEKGAALVAGLRAPHLTSLDLANTSLTGSGAWRVLRSPLLEGLTQLSLRGNRLTDAELSALPGLSHQLTLLNLKKNKLSAAFLKKLTARFPQTRLSR